MHRTALWALVLVVPVFGATPSSSQRNFIACPIIRDTLTVPCWLAEYDGELYYLGVQTEINADWHPPYLGHQMLVEGTVSNESRICGGIVLKPNKISVLPELDATCNRHLPAEDRYTVPFAPRGPGPSKDGVPVAISRAEFIVPYEFDGSSITGTTAGVLQQVVHYAKAIDASHIEVTGYRGAVLLSDGKIITEKDGIAAVRAKQIVELLQAAGVPEKLFEAKWRDEVQTVNGRNDFEQRRVIIVVRP